MFNLEKFSEDTALITETAEISYRELANISEQVGDAVNQRCLVFLLRLHLFFCQKCRKFVA